MRVIRNFFYNISYQILILIAPLITVPYVSRVLGASGVGINTFTNSVIQYFVLFGSIGITLYGSREIAYVQDDKKARSQYFFEIEGLKLITVTLAYIVFFLFLMVYKKFQSYMVFQSILILAAGFDISWFYNGLENFKVTVMRNALVKTLSIILIFMFVKEKSDLGVYILLLSISQLLGNLSLWPYLKMDIVWTSLKKINVFRHLKPAIQMFIPQIAIQIYWVLNRTMLGQFVSVESAGFFQYADQFIKMSLAIVTATGPVLLPRVSNAFAKRDSKKVHMYLTVGLEFVSMLAFPMIFGISAIALKFAPWFMGADFNPVGKLMIWETPVILFIAWSGVIGQQFLLPVKRVSEYTTSVIIGAIVNIVLNFLLITSLKATGAIIATVVAEMCVTVYQLYRIRNDISIFKMILNCWPYFVSSVIMYIPVKLYINLFRINLLNFVIAIIIGILVYSLMMIILKVPIYKLGMSILEEKFKH